MNYGHERQEIGIWRMLVLYFVLNNLHPILAGVLNPDCPLGPTDAQVISQASILNIWEWNPESHISKGESQISHFSTFP